MDDVLNDLVRVFKSHVRSFLSQTQPAVVTDSVGSLIELCACIQELLIGRGSNERGATLFLDHTRNRLFGKNFCPELSTFRLLFENVFTCKKVRASLGRFRLLIRYLLNSGKFGEFLVELKPSENANSSLFPSNSILRDDIAFEVFCSAALSLGIIKFKLDVGNASLLDFSWVIPETKYIEAIPANRYGFGVERIDDFLFVGRIYVDCILAEQISVGDMIDEIYDLPARDVSDQLVDKFFIRAHREPLRMKILKYRFGDGIHCSSLDSFIQRSKYAKENIALQERAEKPKKHTGEVDIPTEGLLANWNADVSPAYVSGENSLYKVKYLGSQNLGNKHSASSLSDILKRRFETSSATTCIILLNETHIKVIPCSTESSLPPLILEEKSFIDIPCCGRGELNENQIGPTNFGYICRNSSDQSVEFVCHVFQSSSPDDVVRILCTLAQGFERTAWLF